MARGHPALAACNKTDDKKARDRKVHYYHRSLEGTSAPKTTASPDAPVAMGTSMAPSPMGMPSS